MQNSLNSIFQNSDGEYKTFISVVYRVLLIVYGLIFCIKKEVDISYWTLGLLCLLYLVFFYFLYEKSIFLSNLRLLNDYLFIGVLVYKSSNIDVYALSYLFIPILNSRNHSGLKKSLLLYAYPIIIICLIQEEFSFWYTYPFIFFIIINSFDSLRNKDQKLYNELNEIMDSFLIEKESFQNLYKIYDAIIPIFNKKNFFMESIVQIFCFEKKDDKLIIINGSVFIWDYQIHPDDIKLLKNKTGISQNIRIKVNNIQYERNVIYCCKIDSTIYYYFLMFDPFQSLKNNIKRIVKPYYVRILRPFFSRLSHAIKAHNDQILERKENYEKMTEKTTYVNNAVSSMHFIRNKLSPLKGYLAMVKDYESSDSDKKIKIRPYMERERKKLSNSLEEILNKANNILEKSNNPFNVVENKMYSIEKLLSILRDVWNYYLPKENFIFKLKTDRDKIKNIRFNETGIELVAINWVSNIKKYKTDDNYGIIFKEKESSFEVIFFNSFDDQVIKEPDFVKLFNSDDRMAILKRNTHGLIEIKDFLDQMNIKSRMYCDDGLLYLKLELLKNFTNENPDI